MLTDHESDFHMDAGTGHNTAQNHEFPDSSGPTHARVLPHMHQTKCAGVARARKRLQT